MILHIIIIMRTYKAFGLSAILLLDADGKAVFDSIRKRGYGCAISVKCGKNVPIYISFD